MRHEQGHQWINKATLDYFLPLFFSQARTAIREVRAVKIYSKSDIDAAYKQLNKYYETSTMKLDWSRYGKNLSVCENLNTLSLIML